MCLNTCECDGVDNAILCLLAVRTGLFICTKRTCKTCIPVPTYAHTTIFVLGCVGVVFSCSVKMMTLCSFLLQLQSRLSWAARLPLYFIYAHMHTHSFTHIIRIFFRYRSFCFRIRFCRKRFTFFAHFLLFLLYHRVGFFVCFLILHGVCVCSRALCKVTFTGCPSSMGLQKKNHTTINNLLCCTHARVRVRML